MSINLDTADRAALRAALVAHFPSTQPTDEAIDAYAIALHAMKQGSPVDLGKYGAALDAAAKAVSLDVADDVEELTLTVPSAGTLEGARYYQASATHDRERPDLKPFTGHLWLARVPLPRSGAVHQVTALGSVEARDHLLTSIEAVEKQYAGMLARPVARVDLITPARLCGTRFGAISIYLGYYGGDTIPDFYILEAGTAIGEARVLYFSPTMTDQLVKYTGYEPTPFAKKTHIYVARLTMRGDSPDLLRVSAHKDEATSPYMRLAVTFNESKPPSHPEWPGFLTTRAFMIVLSRLPKIPASEI